jgi:hypothetical protein
LKGRKEFRKGNKPKRRKGREGRSQRFLEAELSSFPFTRPHRVVLKNKGFKLTEIEEHVKQYRRDDIRHIQNEENSLGQTTQFLQQI